MIMLVSNSFAELGSCGPSPLVAVCGTVSSFVTVITSPFATVSESGAYAGFPGVEEPVGIDSVGPPDAAGGAGGEELDPVVADSDAPGTGTGVGADVGADAGLSAVGGAETGGGILAVSSQ